MARIKNLTWRPSNRYFWDGFLGDALIADIYLQLREDGHAYRGRLRQPNECPTAEFQTLQEAKDWVTEQITGEPVAKVESTLRMRAYYFSFEPTGNRAIDKILSAVAVAGKSYHNTSEWSEPINGTDGESYVDAIQNAANAAAEEIAKGASA